MKIITLTGKIKLVSGLHIGGGDDTMRIGGIDNQVIKDANTGYPYIPGSSLKGKMRSLLEWHLGLVGISEGEPFSPKFLKNAIFNDKQKFNNAITLLKLFGSSIIKADEKVIKEKGLEKEFLGITRINVGDCYLTKDMIQKYENKEIKLSEAKYENVIDRCSGTAKHPRQTERVPAGVEFDFDIRVKILPGDDKEAVLGMVKKGLELVESDYLGGNGSRGYGRVKFLISE